MSRRLFTGQLEIDARGVIYFHSSERGGATILRIQGLPGPIPTPDAGSPLDIAVVTDEWEAGKGLCKLRANWITNSPTEGGAT